MVSTFDTSFSGVTFVISKMQMIVCERQYLVKILVFWVLITTFPNFKYWPLVI